MEKLKQVSFVLIFIKLPETFVMSNKKNAPITSHFTHEDQQAILSLAAEEGISASEWIRNLVTTHLDEQRSHVVRMAEILGVRKTLCELEERGMSDN